MLLEQRSDYHFSKEVVPASNDSIRENAPSPLSALYMTSAPKQVQSLLGFLMCVGTSTHPAADRPLEKVINVLTTTTLARLVTCSNGKEMGNENRKLICLEAKENE